MIRTNLSASILIWRDCGAELLRLKERSTCTILVLLRYR